MNATPGLRFPLGATPLATGTNFAVASNVAEGLELCLFDAAGEETRIPFLDVDAGVWHAFVPDVGPGQAYGLRATGPYRPADGIRCNPAKLLLDPYARAIHGEVTFGPEVLGYDPDRPDEPSSLDSAGHVPRSLVVDPAFDWGTDLPRQRRLADSIVYELHVKGFTMAHPDVPPELRGTYAGLAHEAATSHLVDLGVTAVELLPVHRSVPEAFLVERGLTNYWGYNTIGFFAPHEGYSAAARAGDPLGAVREFKAMVLRAARGRARGDPRRGVQPHRRGERAGPHVVPPRPRQPGLLPARPRRPQPLPRHDRVRQHPQRRRPALPPADHGLAAVLGHRHARRRLPLRPGAVARPAGGSLRPGVGVLRPGLAGPRRVAGQAHRRAVGRGPGRQLRPGPVPAAVERVERPLPRHHAATSGVATTACSASSAPG